MQEKPSQIPAIRQLPKKLIMVIEQDGSIGAQFVRLIQQETLFQAILATSLQQVQSILHHLTCDVFLLTDDTFPEEDLERLYLLPAEVKPPACSLLSILIWGSRALDESADTMPIVGWCPIYFIAV